MGRSVSVIDARTESAISIAVGMFPNALAVNPVTNLIYVVVMGEDTVKIIDGETDTISDSFTIAQAAGGIAVNPVTNRIYLVTGNPDNKIYVFNGADNTLITSFAVGNDPGHPVVNTQTNRVYVANYRDDTLTVVDGVTNMVIDTLTGVGTGPLYAAVDETKNKIYVSATGSNEMTVINGATNTIETSVAVGNNPRAVVVDAANDRIYVALRQDDAVAVIDRSTYTLLSTFAVGDAPGGMALLNLIPVDFDMNDGTGALFASEDYFYNDTVLPPSPAPEREGSTFVGWFEEPVGLNPDPADAYDFSLPLTESLILYAGWAQDTYTVTFDGNGEGVTNLPDPVTVEGGQSIGQLPEPPRRAGYTFAGWFLDPVSTASPFTAQTPVNADITVYAHWNPETDGVSFWDIFIGLLLAGGGIGLLLLCCRRRRFANR